jgi:bla regulator protein blaR1
MAATQLIEVLASYSLQVLVIVSIARLLERSVRNSSDRCSIWNYCFLSILLLGVTSLLLPRFHFFQPWSYLDPHKLLTVSSVQGVVGRSLLAVWLIGMALATIRWFARAIWLQRMVRCCRQLDPREVRRLVNRINGISIAEPLPTILICDEDSGPCCWQLHQPIILLPEFILEASQDDLRNVLVHELEHLRTNHPLHLFLQQIVQIVCWFHPAVWSAAGYASLAREYVCDDAAAHHASTSAAYLRTLLRIAERQCERNRLAQAIGFGRSRSEVVLRAHRLAHSLKGGTQKFKRWIAGRKTIAWVFILATCLLSQAWIPFDSMSSSRSSWSPWPTWTAQAMHIFGISLRDYEQFDRRVRAYELHYENGPS